VQRRNNCENAEHCLRPSGGPAHVISLAIHQQNAAPAIVLAEVLRATPTNLLPLSCGANLLSLLLNLLVSLGDLLLEFGERRLRRR